MPKTLITLRVDASTLTEVDTKATSLGLDRTTVITRLLEEFLQGRVDIQVAKAEPAAHLPELSYSSMTAQRRERLIRDISARMEQNPHTGCWNWTGAPVGSPEPGVLTVLGLTQRAHRVSYALFKSHIPEGMTVSHSCGNARCINPTHLVLGTPQESLHEQWKARRVEQGRTLTPTIITAFPGTFSVEDLGRPISEQPPTRKSG